MAAPRDWALGETLLVSHPSLRVDGPSVIAYTDAVHLGWEGTGFFIEDMSRPSAPRALFDSWGAVESWLLERFTPDER